MDSSPRSAAENHSVMDSSPRPDRSAAENHTVLWPGVFGGAISKGAVWPCPQVYVDGCTIPPGVAVPLRPTPAVLREWAATTLGVCEVGGVNNSGGWFATRSARTSAPPGNVA
jgi:hypothetical protein